MSHHPSSSHMLSALIQYASGLLKLEICQSFSDLPSIMVVTIPHLIITPDHIYHPNPITGENKSYQYVRSCGGKGMDIVKKK